MFNELVERLREYDSAVLGFSGGVDSSLVAYALKTAGIPFTCVTVHTPLQTESELAQSAFFCEKYEIDHVDVMLNVLDISQVRSNSRDRCYYCKKAIFGFIKEVAKDIGYGTVLDGSNADDLREYRPGLKAKDELGVESPLAELNFTKAHVRAMSKEQGLPTWDMPSSPCLATRVPYDMPLNTKVIRAVGQAEKILLDMGAGNIRVRAHGDVARIEAEDRDKLYRLFDERAVKAVKDCGFQFVCIDMDGYKRGCYD